MYQFMPNIIFFFFRVSYVGPGALEGVGVLGCGDTPVQIS